jgi:hypothetical protein
MTAAPSLAQRKAPPVRRISIPWLLQIVESIQDLRLVSSEGEQQENGRYLHEARNSLDSLFLSSIYSIFLRVSMERAENLRRKVSDALEKLSELREDDVWAILDQRRQFLSVFHAELNTLPSFLVVDKESYDVNILVDYGHRLFPQTLITKVPEAKKDADEVGKALAFELGTACGFHMFRVVEAVLKKYWDVVSGGSERPRLQTIGSFALELEKKDSETSKL